MNNLFLNSPIFNLFCLKNLNKESIKKLKLINWIVWDLKIIF